jgi:uncharacterized phosphosugar-binding protein
MGEVARKYRDHVVQVLDRIVSEQATMLDAARDAVAAALSTDRLIYVTGSGHSHLIAAEAFFRAGGIAAVQPMFDPALMLHVSASQSSLAERETGRAEAVLAEYQVGSGDVVFIASNSGRNAYPVEMAMAARDRGATTIALTSMQHTAQVSSRHPSGQRLFELVDIVLDNGAPHGDASVDVGPDGLAMGPISTISGAFIVNAVIAEAVDLLAGRGCAIDVYRSSNGEGGETAVEAIVDRWRPRIRGL